MSACRLYHQVRRMFKCHIDARVDASSVERLTLLVVGMIKARSASPARIAEAVAALGLSGAQPASIERRVRRIENDPEICAELCVHPLARRQLLLGKPQELLLIMDPTTQDDRVVMLTAAVWYRGRALPIAWAIWPNNQPLKGARFWERTAALLAVVAQLVPRHVPIIWLADRAFGSPAFIDLLAAYQWHYVVRVIGHTKCQDRRGVERPIKDLVQHPGQRRKLRGWAFKAKGWREASVVVYWGHRHQAPLCLVSNLGTQWYLIRLYRRRYPIEATFRDLKSHGWHWEQGQVTDLDHVERLLVGMALATWIALAVGTQVATELLRRQPTGHRRTLPWEGKRSLFTLGLQRLACWLHGNGIPQLGSPFSDWDAPNWQTQIRARHAHAFVFARCSSIP
jgi:hypothetical protein